MSQAIVCDNGRYNGRTLRDWLPGVVERIVRFLPSTWTRPRQRRGPRLVDDPGHGQPNETLVTRRGGKVAMHGNTKFAMHMVRLGVQGVELMETGRISLPIREPWLAWLQDLRQGRHSKDEALAAAAYQRHWAPAAGGAVATPTPAAGAAPAQTGDQRP